MSGTYPTPSADTALNYARNQILLAEADARGITVSDEEMASHAEETIGTSDFSAMAEQYNLSEEQAKEVVRQQTTLQKLYDQIVPEVNASMPTAPPSLRTATPLRAPRIMRTTSSACWATSGIPRPAPGHPRMVPSTRRSPARTSRPIPPATRRP